MSPLTNELNLLNVTYGEYMEEKARILLFPLH